MLKSEASTVLEHAQQHIRQEQFQQGHEEKEKIEDEAAADGTT